MNALNDAAHELEMSADRLGASADRAKTHVGCCGFRCPEQTMAKVATVAEAGNEFGQKPFQISARTFSTQSSRLTSEAVSRADTAQSDNQRVGDGGDRNRQYDRPHKQYRRADQPASLMHALNAPSRRRAPGDVGQGLRDRRPRGQGARDRKRQRPLKLSETRQRKSKAPRNARRQRSWRFWIQCANSTCYPLELPRRSSSRLQQRTRSRKMPKRTAAGVGEVAHSFGDIETIGGRGLRATRQTVIPAIG